MFSSLNRIPHTIPSYQGAHLKPRGSSNEHVIKGSAGLVTYCTTQKLLILGWRTAFWGCCWSTLWFMLKDGVSSFGLQWAPLINESYMVLCPLHMEYMVPDKCMVVPLTIPPNDLPREYMSSVNSWLWGYRDSGSKNINTSTRGTAGIPLNFKRRLLPRHFKPLVPRDQQARKDIILAGATDHGHQKKVGLFLHNEDRKDYVWHWEGPLGHLLIIP